MRILHVTYIFPPEPNVADGITQVVYRQTRTLAKKGHNVTVYASNALDLHGKGIIVTNSSPVYIDGVKVRYFSYLLRYNTFFFTPSIIYSVRDDIKEFDVIHVHDARCPQCAVTTYYAELFNIPVVFQPHGSFASPFPSGSLRKFSRLFIDVVYAEKAFKKASKVVALSRIEAEQYRGMGVPEEKIEVIPNGIDLSEYGNLPPKGSFKKKFDLPENKKVILYLGRIHKIKGIDFLVKAYAYLIKDAKCNDAVLAIAGPEDGYLRELQALIKTLKIEDDVLILGPLYGGDKLEAYVDANVFVLPSRYETFPMSVLEAYACGKSVIASRIGGLRDLVIDRVTGLLFDLGDVKSLASSIFYLMNNEDKANEMGLRGKQFVDENFTIERVVDKLEDLYDTMFSAYAKSWGLFDFFRTFY